MNIKKILRNVFAVVVALTVTGTAFAASTYYQGFETDTSGWFDSTNGWYGLVTRVSSGTGGIVSSEGDWHAVFTGDTDSAPFSRFDVYRAVWPGTWTAEVDVYLDPTWGIGTGFDYSVAATGTNNAHRRDFIFHVTKDTSAEKLFVGGSNNSNFAPREDLENINHYEVATAGWYTLQHVFRDNGGVLAVDLNLLDSNGGVLFTETRSDASDLIPSVVGGNRYAWFTFINVSGGINVDAHELILTVGPPTLVDDCKKDGWMSFNNPEFKNQGDCVSYVQSSEKAVGN